MPKKYRSPTSTTAAAAAAPARLAEQYGGYSLWRYRPGGALEVATVQDGCVYRHLVHDDGSTTVIETTPPGPGRRWSTPLAYGGFGLCVATMIGLVIAGDDVAFGKGFLLFLAGMALVAVGAFLGEDNLEKRLKNRADGAGTWHEAAKLNGWAPRTSEQLTAVEHLADQHKGVAYVRDVGARTVDVLVRHRGCLDRYWVDEAGGTELADSTRPRCKDLVVAATRFLAFPLFISIFVVWVTVHGRARAGLIFGLTVACLASLAVILSKRSEAGLPYRAHQFEDNGLPWLEIRTIEEESN